MTRPAPERDQDGQEPPRFTRGRLSRGKSIRSATGCLTCLRRRVKCDEGKPNCGPCTRLKIECQYNAERRVPRRRGPKTRNSGKTASEGHETPVSLPRDDTIIVPQPTKGSSAEAPEHDVPSGLSILMENNAPASSGQVHEDIPTNDGINAASVDQANHHSSGCDANSPITTRTPQSPRESRRFSQIHSIIYGGPSPPQFPFSPVIWQLTGPSESVTGHSVESLTSRWLNLLVGDAESTHGPLPNFDLDPNGLDVFGNTSPETPAGNGEPKIPQPDDALPPRIRSSHARHPFITTRVHDLQERVPCQGEQLLEKEKNWEATDPIVLEPREHTLFQHFVQHISRWMDLFEPQRPFATLVPHLALRNVGLMNAILALSARHLSIPHAESPSPALDFSPDANLAVGYYYKTLHYSQKAMQYDTYKTSLELLASSLIISSYEMLDGSSTNWEKHLKGVFWIQRSQIIHGDSGGLRQAVWWAWICQDVWAAFREKRKPFTFWRPTRGLEELSPGEIAARSVLNFAQVVGFCANDDENRSKDPGARALEADLLLQHLEHWRLHLTLEFDPLPVLVQPDQAEEPFQPLWIQPAAFGVAMQVYYCSLILIQLHRPASGGLDEYFERQRHLKAYANKVCSIALTLTDYASSIMSSQCVFIAGMIIEDERKRAQIKQVLHICNQRAGWPGYSLSRDLEEVWSRTDHPER